MVHKGNALISVLNNCPFTCIAFKLKSIHLVRIICTKVKNFKTFSCTFKSNIIISKWIELSVKYNDLKRSYNNRCCLIFLECGQYYFVKINILSVRHMLLLSINYVCLNSSAVGERRSKRSRHRHRTKRNIVWIL